MGKINVSDRHFCTLKPQFSKSCKLKTDSMTWITGGILVIDYIFIAISPKNNKLFKLLTKKVHVSDGHFYYHEKKNLNKLLNYCKTTLIKNK